MTGGWASLARVAVAAAVAVAASGCHHHRDLNAPGVIDPMLPPAALRDRELEYPGDPGERMLMVTTGVLGGAMGGSTGGAVDLAGEVTVSWGENPITHNDRASRLFIPRGVLIPPRSHGVTLGWSALRVPFDDRPEANPVTGPIYLEVQRSWTFAGVGGGWAYDPRTGGTGPQVNAFYTFYFVRGRFLLGDGWELGGGLQLKIPNTWVHRR